MQRRNHHLSAPCPPLEAVCVCHFAVEYIPGAVPPRASSGSVLYLSPSLLLLKLASQGLYPGTVVAIELTQRLAWRGGRETKASVEEDG